MKTTGKKIEKPEINSKLLYGEIVQWNFRPTVTPAKGKYCFRFSLLFENGVEEKFQKGGFDSKKSATKAREIAITQLYERNYVPFSFTVKEFYDYWLYYHMIEEKGIAYNTYTNYRSVIYNYFLKVWGTKKKMNELTREDLMNALDMFNSKKSMMGACAILGNSMAHAKAKNVIAIDFSESVIRIVKNKFKIKEEEKNKNASEQELYEKYISSHKVLNAEQAALLLWKSKEEEPKLFYPLMFTITAGLRISEALAVKFSDIDFGKKELHVNGQIGRSIKDIGLESGELCSQKIEPKTKNGYRSIPIPDFVIEEIIMAKQQYDINKCVVADFYDYGYICFQENGKPYRKELLYRSYRKMLNICELPELKWHELRHTYSTLLAQHGVSMKAISVCMGHFSEGFTRAVYVVPEKVVFDAVDEIMQFAKEVLPNKNTINQVEISEKYILEVLPKNYYNEGAEKGILT